MPSDPPDISDLPDRLLAREQWLCWRATERDGKPTKVPVDPSTGRFGSATDPATWTSFEDAKRYLDAKAADGLGFAFTDDDPLVGVDLDDCRDPESGTIDEWARDVVDQLDSYTEVSPSGTGLHVLVRGELTGDRNRRGDLEIYESARYFTVTGEPLPGTPETIRDRQAELDAVVEDQLIGDSSTEDDWGDREAGQTDDSPRSLPDDELIDRATNAANGEKFHQLWTGDWSAYESHSEADMALCMLLAFWTGRDATQMDRLFRRSGLYREKWDEPHYSDGRTYGEGTIERAIAQTDEVYESDHSLSDVFVTAETEGLSPDARDRLRDREAERVESIERLQAEIQRLEARNAELERELEYVQENKVDAPSKSDSNPSLLDRLRHRIFL